MQDIGVAVIGTGFMGRVHVEALKRIGVQIVGICGSTPEKSRSAAETMGLARSYDSFAQVLQDDTVHSVHIGTPNRTHCEMTKQALAAGKHVMCEKPLAMTSIESAELVQTAREYPRLAAAVNYNIRYYPLCLEARERVRNGQLGDVVHATGSYVQDWLTYPSDYNWRVVAEQNGELRAVADVGTHWLDLIQFITGLNVESVCADLKTVHPIRQRPNGEVETFSSAANAQLETPGGVSPVDVTPVNVTTDDYGAILLRLNGDVRGSLHVSQVTPGRKNCVRFEIAGSNQTMAWNSEQPNELWIGHRDRANESLIRDPSLMAGVEARGAADYPGGHNEGYPDSFKQCFRAFYDFIDRGDFEAPATFPTFADGHQEILLCDAVLKSHRNRCWVDIDKTEVATKTEVAR